MIGDPVASVRDLQRYKELLLDKQRELSSVQDDAETRVPASGGLEGDLIDQANADAEAELQIRLHQTDARLFCLHIWYTPNVPSLIRPSASSIAR